MPERGAGGGQNSPAKVRFTERQLEALTMRRSRATFQQIGDALGITRQAAKMLVHRAYTRLEIERDEMSRYSLLEELETLDAMLRVAYPMATSGNLTREKYDALTVKQRIAVDELRLKAVGKVLSIGEQRAKLLGLNSPEKHLWFGYGQFSVSANEAAEQAEQHAGFLESSVEEGEWEDVS